jgi:hypothetical protein
LKIGFVVCFDFFKDECACIFHGFYYTLIDPQKHLRLPKAAKVVSQVIILGVINFREKKHAESDCMAVRV